MVCRLYIVFSEIMVISFTIGNHVRSYMRQLLEEVTAFIFIRMRWFIKEKGG